MTTPPPFATMPGRRRRRRDADGHAVPDLGRLLLGLSVVAIGVLFLLDAAGSLDAGAAIEDWWPAVIVAGGLLTFAERPPALYRGLVVTAIGATLLLFTTGTVDESAWSYVWPAAIVAAGVAVLLHWSGRAIAAPAAHSEDVVRSTGILGGPSVASSSQSFRGAWLTAVFGGVTLDLRSAKLAEGGASINATAAFGGIEILVPHGWRVSVRATPILGGVEDRTQHPSADDAPVLRVDAVAILGGVDIKHDK